MVGLTMMLCLLQGLVGRADAQQQAGITMADATWVTQPTTLRVQSGFNYIRLPETYLSAAVVYMPDSAFGPIPSMLVDGVNELTAQRYVANCRQG